MTLFLLSPLPFCCSLDYFFFFQQYFITPHKVNRSCNSSVSVKDQALESPNALGESRSRVQANQTPDGLVRSWRGTSRRRIFRIPSFLPSPKMRCRTSPSLTQVGAGRRTWVSPGRDRSPFSQWLCCDGRRWAGSLSPNPSLCFRCCLFCCRNIIPSQPKKNYINLQLFTCICQCGHKTAGMDNLHRFICHDDRHFNVL